MRTRILVVISIAFCFVVAFAFSPAQLTSITHGIDFLYQKAEVKNVSDRTVSSVTFGVLLHETDPNQSKPIVALSQQVPTDIKPGQVGVDVLGLRTKESQEKASQLKSNTVVAEFGVLGVQFEDGGSWTFDLEKNRTLSSSPIATSSGGESLQFPLLWPGEASQPPLTQ